MLFGSAERQLADVDGETLGLVGFDPDRAHEASGCR
jgi:hypothetical protein